MQRRVVHGVAVAVFALAGMAGLAGPAGADTITVSKTSGLGFYERIVVYAEGTSAAPFTRNHRTTIVRIADDD